MQPASTNDAPLRPRTVEGTGLTLSFIAAMALRLLYVHGPLLGHEISDALKLPFAGVIDKVLEHLRDERSIEVIGGETVGETTFRFTISQKGRTRARELLNQTQYVGPAPVTLEAYTEMMAQQTVTGHAITPEAVRKALSHLVLDDSVVNRLGPAVISGKTLFLYGNTGDGKTSIAEAISCLIDAAMWIPYAVVVDDQIIRVFDNGHHRVFSTDPMQTRSGALRYLAPKTDRVDHRWVLIHRPFIAVGGELTLKSLNLIYDPTLKYYEAPYQMKANGGIFLVDDFGRQRAQPKSLLNRWIIPLEKRVDHLTLAMGQKIDVPFDLMVIFSTNLNPQDLVDESYLRRFQYKIRVPDPSWDEYREIFLREAAKREVEFTEEGFQYLISEYYVKPRRKPRAVHPRDILEELVEYALFHGLSMTLSAELIDLACQSYFIKKQPSD